MQWKPHDTSQLKRHDVDELGSLRGKLVQLRERLVSSLKEKLQSEEACGAVSSLGIDVATRAHAIPAFRVDNDGIRDQPGCVELASSLNWPVQSCESVAALPGTGHRPPLKSNQTDKRRRLNGFAEADKWVPACGTSAALVAQADTGTLLGAGSVCSADLDPMQVGDDSRPEQGNCGFFWGTAADFLRSGSLHPQARRFAPASGRRDHADALVDKCALEVPAVPDKTPVLGGAGSAKLGPVQVEDAFRPEQGDCGFFWGTAADFLRSGQVPPQSARLAPSNADDLQDWVLAKTGRTPVRGGGPIAETPRMKMAEDRGPIRTDGRGSIQGAAAAFMRSSGATHPAAKHEQDGMPVPRHVACNNGRGFNSPDAPSRGFASRDSPVAIPPGGSLLGPSARRQFRAPRSSSR